MMPPCASWYSCGRRSGKTLARGTDKTIRPGWEEQLQLTQYLQDLRPHLVHRGSVLCSTSCSQTGCRQRGDHWSFAFRCVVVIICIVVADVGRIILLGSHYCRHRLRHKWQDHQAEKRRCVSRVACIEKTSSRTVWAKQWVCRANISQDELLCPSAP